MNITKSPPNTRRKYSKHLEFKEISDLRSLTELICFSERDPRHICIYFDHTQWNLKIRDTQGTVKNWIPEYWGGLISQVHFYVLNRPIGSEVVVLNSQVVPTSQVVVQAGFTVHWSHTVCFSGVHTCPLRHSQNRYLYDPHQCGYAHIQCDLKHESSRSGTWLISVYFIIVNSINALLVLVPRGMVTQGPSNFNTGSRRHGNRGSK